MMKGPAQKHLLYVGFYSNRLAVMFTFLHSQRESSHGPDSHNRHACVRVICSHHPIGRGTLIQNYANTPLLDSEIFHEFQNRVNT